MRQEKLLQVRKRRGLTQKQVAAFIGVEQTTYSKKERGISMFKEEEWEVLAKVLDVPLLAIRDDNPDFSSYSLLSKYRLSSGQFENVPDHVIKIIMNYNKQLEEENLMLRIENEQLKKIRLEGNLK